MITHTPKKDYKEVEKALSIRAEKLGLSDGDYTFDVDCVTRINNSLLILVTMCR